MGNLPRKHIEWSAWHALFLLRTHGMAVRHVDVHKLSMASDFTYNLCTTNEHLSVVMTVPSRELLPSNPSAADATLEK